MEIQFWNWSHSENKQSLLSSIKHKHPTQDCELIINMATSQHDTYSLQHGTSNTHRGEVLVPPDKKRHKTQKHTLVKPCIQARKTFFLF